MAEAIQRSPLILRAAQRRLEGWSPEQRFTNSWFETRAKARSSP